ncbi:DNA polymerase IV [hydrothermal vent metagenome]|uniref:DNA polymerase IV n=1 Tax=hydrothermal vent metagenome TaxID=652676 RepID=A0A3B0Y4U5_9ZZZZ
MPWSRAIILVDMNAFFASVEQYDCPELRGRPVAITNGAVGTCIITSSYEARAYGIKTGMRLKAARQLCPDLIQCPARPERYAEVSTNIMSALQSITPDIEVFSVDEAFLDVTRCQHLLGTPEHIGALTKNIVFEASGILCSIGISGDKTTAKYAAKLNKPDGLTVIPPWQAEQRLKEVPVTELCGIGKGIGKFLNDRGVYVCGDMAALNVNVIAKRFGQPGRRIWHMCQGKDPDDIITNIAAPKSIGHGKVVPPNTTDENTLRIYLLHMSEKVAARLRKHDMKAKHFFIGLLSSNAWLGGKVKTATPTNDGQSIYQLCISVLKSQWNKEGIRQVQVTALNPQLSQHQFEMFEQSNLLKEQCNKVMDTINNQYGEFTLAPARLLNRSTMPNVIAPAWKPFGHRKTI